MSELFMLSRAQMKAIEPWFPLAHGKPRVNDRRVISGIIYVIRNGLRWKDAPMRYDRCAHTFFSAICIAAITIFYLS